MSSFLKPLQFNFIIFIHYYFFIVWQLNEVVAVMSYERLKKYLSVWYIVKHSCGFRFSCKTYIYTGLFLMATQNFFLWGHVVYCGHNQATSNVGAMWWAHSI